VLGRVVTLYRVNTPSNYLMVYVHVCLHPVHCGKMADQFGMVGPMSPKMRQVAGFGDHSMGWGNFGSKYGDNGAPHCNQWGVCGIAVNKCVNRRRCSLGWCMSRPRRYVCSGDVAICQIILDTCSVCDSTARLSHAFLVVNVNKLLS